MAEDPKDLKTPPADLTPEQLAALRDSLKLTASEKQAYDARIAELEAENADLKKKLEGPPPEPEPPAPAKKGIFERFSPL